MAHLLHEIVHVFTHADKSIFAFARQVLLRPGYVVADYLAGQRKRYFNPFQFLLLAVGLATLLSVQLHYYEDIGQALQRGFRSRNAPAEQVARVGQYFYFLGKFFNVWWLTLMPMHALVVWAVYRRWLNYAESFFTLIIVGSAFQLYLMATLIGIYLAGIREPNSGTALLQAGVYAVYFVWIGWQGLELSWPRALLCASVVIVLAGLNYALNMLAFSWYVFGR